MWTAPDHRLGSELWRDAVEGTRVRRWRPDHPLRHRDEGKEHELVGGGQKAHRQGGSGDGRNDQGQAGRPHRGLRIPV